MCSLSFILPFGGAHNNCFRDTGNVGAREKRVNVLDKLFLFRNTYDPGVYTLNCYSLVGMPEPWNMYLYR